MPTALLISNRYPHEDAGRAEKIATRIRLFAERGWDLEISYVSEPYVPTFPLAVARAIKRIRETDPDILISIVNPFHQHLIGYLASTVTGVSWVAEFRDPILTHPDVEEGVLRRAASVVERVTARNADRVVWLDGIQIPEGYFQRTYPDVPSERFVKLPPMGFDAERFDAIQPESFDKFTVTYAGTFYDGWIEPYGYLDGLERYVRDSESHPPLLTRFYGDWSDAYGEAVAKRGLDEYVSVHEFIDHERMVSILKGSDAVLYVGGTDERNRRNLPSKIWDYLGSRTPILALVDESFRVAEFVKDNDLGVVADPRDPISVARAIAALHRGGFQYNPDPSVFATYTRQRHADAYVDVLNSLCVD